METVKKYKHVSGVYTAIQRIKSNSYNIIRVENEQDIVGMAPRMMIENGKDWIPVTEKEYEITMFRTVGNKNTQIVKLYEDGKYWWEDDWVSTGLWSLEQMLTDDRRDYYAVSNGNLEIYQVRRIKDDTLFTLGDTIVDSRDDDNGNTITINCIELKKEGTEIIAWNGDKYANARSGIDIKYWKKVEQVQEKEYEVISYADDKGNVLRKYSNGRYAVYPDATILNYTEEQCIEKGLQIHSVKRLSDNEVFSVGDRIVWDWISNTRPYETIDEIKIEDSGQYTIYRTKENGYKTSHNLNRLVTEWNLRHYTEPEQVEEQYERELIVKLKGTKEGIEYVKNDIG